jgi:hypothetical protein
MGRDEATSTRNLEDRLLEFNKMGRSLKITILSKPKSRLRTYLSEVDKEEGQCSGRTVTPSRLQGNKGFHEARPLAL